MTTAAASGLLGVVLGFLFCWYVFVRSLTAGVEARDRSLREWEEVNRIEREKIAAIQMLSAEEMRRWVAAVDAQNTSFAELQQRLHRQELELVGPAYTQLGLAVLALVGVAGFVAWMVRDANAEAARTLESAVAVLPALHEAIRTAHGSELPGSVREQLALHSVRGEYEPDSTARRGLERLRFISSASRGHLV